MIDRFYNCLLKVFSNSKGLMYAYYEEKYSFADAYEVMKKLNGYLSDYKRKKVVLYGEKTFQVYCALYAILLSDNIWIPITPGLPDDRMFSMLDVLKPDLVLSENNLPEGVQSYALKNGVKTAVIEDLLSQSQSKEFLVENFDANDLAYIMFTSGSTGVPKGVPMTHLNYINFIENALEILPFEKEEIFSDYHDFAFDISIFYLFCAPLTESAISPIRKPEERMFPLNHIQKNKITVWSSVPSVISCLQRFRPNEKLKNTIKIMFLCGEPFRLSVLDYCYECLEIDHVYNFYGLTETGVENFYHPCVKDDVLRFQNKGFVPIGKPLKGNEIKVTEEKELLLSGCQLTPGYLGGIGKDRFEYIDGVRWYHTGDIVEIDDGLCFCKGRLDSQVKISGHRIELMDVEVHLRSFKGIKEAICFVEDAAAVTRLVCAVETEGEELGLLDIQKWLSSRVPSYMIPKKLFYVDQMPTNKNGKIDRKAIKEMFS